MQQEETNIDFTATESELGIELTHRFEKVSLSDEEFTQILDIVSWKQTPIFPRRGRMAWQVFEQPPILMDGHQRSLAAAKIKGVGVYNPSVDAKYRDPVYHIASERPFQPTNQPLLSFSTYPHFGINDKCEFGFTFGKTAPIGGILHDKAICEYNCALHLLKHDVPAIVPLAVVKYNSLPKFNGESLGAAICLSPSKFPYRLGEIQSGAALRPGLDKSKDEYCRLLFESAEINGGPYNELKRLELLKHIAFNAGKLINDFSASGLFRYSAALQNFEYDFDKRQLVLTDLDSSLFLNTLPPNLQRLQVIRDFGSLLYHFTVGFATPLALGHYSLKNLVESDPISALISGYFSINIDARVRRIASTLWSLFIPHFVLLNRHRQEIDNKWSVERRRSYKMEHDLFFVTAMTISYPLFCENRLSTLYPDGNLTQDQMIAKARNYLGQRFEYLEYLVNRS